MRVGMVFGGFAGMVRGVKSVTMGDVGVVRGLLVVSLLVMFSRFAVVRRSVLVMFGSFSMVFRSFVVHRIILFRGEMWGRRLQADRAAVQQDSRQDSVTA